MAKSDSGKKQTLYDVIINSSWSSGLQLYKSSFTEGNGGKVMFPFAPSALSLMRAEYKKEQETAVLKYIEYWREQKSLKKFTILAFL